MQPYGTVIYVTQVILSYVELAHWTLQCVMSDQLTMLLHGIHGVDFRCALHHKNQKWWHAVRGSVKVRLESR